MTTCNLAVNGPVKPLPVEPFGGGIPSAAPTPSYGTAYPATTGTFPVAATQPAPTTGGGYGGLLNGAGQYRAPYPNPQQATTGAPVPTPGAYGASTAYQGYGY